MTIFAAERESPTPPRPLELARFRSETAKEGKWELRPEAIDINFNNKQQEKTKNSDYGTIKQEKRYAMHVQRSVHRQRPEGRTEDFAGCRL